MTCGRTAASISGTVFPLCLHVRHIKSSIIAALTPLEKLYVLLSKQCIFAAWATQQPRVVVCRPALLCTSVRAEAFALKHFFFFFFLLRQYVLCTAHSLLLSDSMQWFVCSHELFPVCDGILIILQCSVPGHIFHLCPVFSIKKKKSASFCLSVM